MRTVLTSPELAFLDGDAVGTDLPIRVIQAARRKLNIINAMPKSNQMERWQSLDYRPEPAKGPGHCSIRVLDGWRMELCSDREKEPPTMHVVSIQGVSNVG